MKLGGRQRQWTSGEANIVAALVNAMEPYRTATGSYRLQNEYCYLTATNPRSPPGPGNAIRREKKRSNR